MTSLDWPMQDGANPFSVRFDDHFNVRTAFVDDACQGKTPVKKTTPLEFMNRCADFPIFKKDPRYWGIKVQLIKKLWEFVQADLLGYCSAHCVDDAFRHMCLLGSCQWKHYCAPCAPNPTMNLEQMLRPSMHVVVERYVKPWTQHRGIGLSLLLNAAHVARRSTISADEYCYARVFISHCWSERFDDFVVTLEQALDPNIVVWVCSFALYQHDDISAALESLDNCPFAIALQASSRVLVVTDKTAEAFERCWCVFEAGLAHRWKIPYDISLPEDGNEDLWNRVSTTLETLDVRNCKASNPRDKDTILACVSELDGGIADLNQKVHALSKAAVGRAAIIAAAATCNTRFLQHVSVEDLSKMTNISGMTVTHIAAYWGHLPALLAIHNRLEDTQVNRIDDDGRTPLSVAAERGNVNFTKALLVARASVSGSTNESIPFKALHYAAAAGHAAILDLLMNEKADVNEKVPEARNEPGEATALGLAARYQHTACMRLLLSGRADPQQRNRTGRSALHTAALWGKAESVALLLAAKADVHMSGSHDRTPLMVAAQHGHYLVTLALLGAGADTNTMATDGSTAKDLCLWEPLGSKQDMQSVIDILETAGRNEQRGSSCSVQCVIA